MSGQQRATIVVKVGGHEVARRQVRVSDGDTLELEVPVRDVTAVRDVTDAVVREAARSMGGAQFRATTGREEQKKKDGTA